MSVFIVTVNTTLKRLRICHIQHVSAIFGHHQVETQHNMENYTEVEASHVCYFKIYLWMAKNGRNML